MIKAILLAVGCTLALGSIRGENSFGTWFELKNSLNILQNTVRSLKQQNERLRTEIYKIRSSSAYAQKVLKDKYHLTDEKEEIIFLAD